MPPGGRSKSLRKSPQLQHRRRRNWTYCETCNSGRRVLMPARLSWETVVTLLTSYCRARLYSPQERSSMREYSPEEYSSKVKSPVLTEVNSHSPCLDVKS